MAKFTTLTSRVVQILRDHIDTDQIIPAAYLKTTTKSGMAQALFAGWRYLPDGSPDPDFVLNRAESAGCSILLAGDNFGCGSSREHAPWALTASGFRAVIAISFADIFRHNALKNSLLPVQLDPAGHRQLCDELAAQPDAPVTIDLAARRLSTPSGSVFPFPIDEFSRACLLNGGDELVYLMGKLEEIVEYESNMEGS